jgi:transcriptional regulator with XRE-family HTH domain
MISEALRLIRVFHDIKQNDLADRLGISKSYLSEIERGHKVPTIDTIEKYSKEFGIPASSIMFFSENINSEERHRGTAKAAISGKIIQFLQFIEVKTSNDQSDSPVSY